MREGQENDEGSDPAAVQTPSPAATDRLRDAMRRSTGELRRRTEADLGMADGLLRAGAQRAAAEALNDYQRVLRAHAAELERMVVDAAVEREAEGVLADALDDAPAEALPASDGAALPALGAGATRAEDGPIREGAERASGVRRILSRALLAAVISAAVLVPNVRAGPQSQVAAAEFEARQELDFARERLSGLQAGPAAAEAVTAEARELHDRIYGLSHAALEREVVREQIRQLLDLEHAALERLGDDASDAKGLLAEIQAIRTSLDLGDPVADPPALLPLPSPPDRGGSDREADAQLRPPSSQMPQLPPVAPGTDDPFGAAHRR